VDVFHGRHEGLIIAEIELADENEEFAIPGWLGEEVTGRPEYYNSNLI
jgi:adenylate cyclase